MVHLSKSEVFKVTQQRVNLEKQLKKGTTKKYCLYENDHLKKYMQILE